MIMIHKKIGMLSQLRSIYRDCSSENVEPSTASFLLEFVRSLTLSQHLRSW